MLEALEKYVLQTYGLSAEGGKADGKKGNARPSSPFLWFNLFSVFFSFLYVQIFPYSQVDSFFQMDHGAISPSLMVLFHTFLLHKQIFPAVFFIFDILDLSLVDTFDVAGAP